ncbi:glycosyltransferase [Paraglaciecola arctica]|uniref:glycosyltransferase n=1 Tax=Paraglaciecola arctica TaxID=1128911 RepID=UPI001C0755E1|nr:glycosyltransferase [Paraglaciecola arctica]MBU3004207.1 glycosyltransferase [Paraglaciecola arctica]
MIDIILPTYNGDKWITECLNSIVNQSYQNWNLYIVDDGSTDRTLSIVQDYITRKNESRINVFNKKTQKGAPSSRMEFLSYSKSEYIAFIDQDDFWHKDKLKLQIEQIVDNNCDLVFGNIEIIDPQSNIVLGKANNENLRRNHFDYSKTYIELAKDIVLYCPIRIGTVLISRSSLISSGGFDLSLTGGEDWEFWVRYICERNKISLLQKVVSYRRVHGENTSIINRIPRLRSWLSAADKISKRYPYLECVIKDFYRNTYLKSIISMMREGNTAQVNLIDNVFKSRVNKKTRLLGVVIVKFWWVNSIFLRLLTKNYGLIFKVMNK